MKHVELLIERYPCLECVKSEIVEAINAIVKAYERGGKILLCGNGGSASDCEHISGELLKGFLLRRPILEGEYEKISGAAREKLQKGVPAIPLTSLSAVFTAFCNDVDPEWAYAQMVFALGKSDDVFIGISTSGNAKNVRLGAETARALGMTTIALTGEKESPLSSLSDVTVRVPESETYKVQELHLPVYHAICAEVERILFGN